jgi:predicted MPP superfamily phosphohydrolase
MSYGYRIEPTWLEVNRLHIPIQDLPPGLAGFRIVQLSDFHCSRQVRASYLAEAVRLAQAQRPDLVVLTGDFIHRGYRYVNTVAELLGAFHAPHGVYGVLGNHDYSVRNALGFRRFRHLHRAVTRSLSAHGIRVLRNESVTLTRGGGHLHLIGVNDLWSGACDLEQAFQKAASDAPCIVLAHNPRTVEHLDDRRCDLMLSGHTHGGQVNLPGVGRPALSRKSRRLAAGLYQHCATPVYVNKGVGFGFRFRFGVRPEVAVITLDPA